MNTRLLASLAAASLLALQAPDARAQGQATDRKGPKAAASAAPRKDQKAAEASKNRSTA